jgi:hypothetical protein
MTIGVTMGVGSRIELGTQFFGYLPTQHCLPVPAHFWTFLKF